MQALRESLPVSLTAFYTQLHPTRAALRFSCDADPGLFVSIIHESMLSFVSDETKLVVEVEDFLGDETSNTLEVESGDVLIILCKRNSHVVASQIFEIDLAAASLGYILIPRGGYNLLVEQEEQLRQDDLDKMHHQEKLYVSISAQ